MGRIALPLLLLSFLALSACSQAPVREDRTFVASINDVELPKGWRKNTLDVEGAIYTAAYRAHGSKSCREESCPESAAVMIEAAVSGPLVRGLGAVKPGDVIGDRPPVKSADHVSNHCVDITYEPVSPMTRRTARSTFMCAGSSTVLLLVEYGPDSIGEAPRSSLVRLIRDKFEH